MQAGARASRPLLSRGGRGALRSGKTPIERQGIRFGLQTIELRRADPADRRPDDAVDLADHARGRGRRRRPARIADDYLETPRSDRTASVPAGTRFANMRALCVRRAAGKIAPWGAGNGAVDPDALHAKDCPVGGQLHRKELHDDISRSLVRLPSRQATAVVMRHVLELSYEEIGGALGCSASTARVHVNRACKKLSRLLAHLAPLHSTESTE